MKKIGFLVYGTAAYALFLVCMVLTIAFTAGFPGPKGLLPVQATEPLWALIINASLVGLFGLQHSLMARKSIKSYLVRFLPQPLVRSSYVLLSSLILMLAVWQWRLIPGDIWQVHDPLGRTAIYVAQGIGWLVLIVATFQIDHFDLFGLRQVYLVFRQPAFPAPTFKAPWLYRLVRHPMMAGLLLAIWSIPDLRIDRLLFNLGMTAYILIGIHYEERDLVQDLGKPYQDYQQRTPKLVPIKIVSNEDRQPVPETKHTT